MNCDNFRKFTSDESELMIHAVLGVMNAKVPLETALGAIDCVFSPGSEALAQSDRERGRACLFCKGHGTVNATLREDPALVYAFACACRAGEKYKRIPKWDQRYVADFKLDQRSASSRMPALTHSASVDSGESR